MDITELVKQMSYLNETIKLIDSNVKFNIQVMWGVLAFAVAAAGAALYYSARFWFQSAMDKKAKEIEQNLLISLRKEMDNVSKTISLGSCLISQKIEPSGVYEFRLTTGGNPSRVKMHFGHSPENGIAYVEITRRDTRKVGIGTFGRSIVLEKAELNGEHCTLIFRNTDGKSISTIDSIAVWEAEDCLFFR